MTDAKPGDDGSSLLAILEEYDLNSGRNSRGTDKGDKKSYVERFYERCLASYRARPVRLLEIGFRHGASLALWSRYFREGSILGVDSFPDVAPGQALPVVEEWVNRPNIKFLVGDAYSKSVADQIDGIFDIVIDDGPHTLASQQVALELYLPKLHQTGVFVIEDIRAGGMAIFPLLKKVPKGFHVRFHDFRWHKMSGDNCLFVVTPAIGSSTLGNRMMITLVGLLYLLAEGPIRLLRRAAKS